MTDFFTFCFNISAFYHATRPLRRLSEAAIVNRGVFGPRVLGPGTTPGTTPGTGPGTGPGTIDVFNLSAVL
jgi:hypothetical protein